MNTSMKIYLVMHKFCNEDYDGNTMLGEEIITSFSTKETAERFVLKWSNPHSAFQSLMTGFTLVSSTSKN